MPTLAEKRCGGKPRSWDRRNKVPVVEPSSCRMRRAPRYIKLATVPTFSFAAIAELGPKLHWR